ncbi:MAG: UbiD family decarboxylase, partial [Deltaproteobacteria bacterium]
RVQVKSPTRTGVMNHPSQHIGIHWAKYKERGLPMPAALVVGIVPAFGIGSVTKYPYGINEFAVAGGLAGEPIETVKCEVVDLEVPATAEMVFEGEIPTDEVEWEAPFGETTGYMGAMTLNGFFNIKCITHRKSPIYQAYISQFPPSESTLLRGISAEAAIYKALKYDCNIPTVTDVALHESCSSWFFLVIQLKKTNPAQVWQALHVASGFDASLGKIFIAVDEDIDPRDADAVNWAMALRMQPHRDVQVVTGKMNQLDPSAVPPNTPYEQAIYPPPSGTSALLIDATMKWTYPPVSLPKREFMENALQIWKELGLPELKPKRPWYGYELGEWTEENRIDAERALRGEHYKTGEERTTRRAKTKDSRRF